MSIDKFKTNPVRAAVTEDDKNSAIFSQSEIVQKLRMLIQGHCLITAHFDDGNQSIITTIIDILPDNFDTKIQRFILYLDGRRKRTGDRMAIR